MCAGIDSERLTRLATLQPVLGQLADRTQPVLQVPEQQIDHVLINLLE